MVQKHVDLLNILIINNSSMTSTQISEVLGVSVRSVKTYINQINEMANAKIVQSTKNGYYVNHQLAALFLAQNVSEVPQSSDERIHYILKRFVLGHTNCINTDELYDALFISDSTLKNEVNKINKKYKHFNIELTFNKSNLLLLGFERDIRKLISHIVFEDLGSEFLDLKHLQKEFTSFDIISIRNLLKSIINKHNYSINDIAMANLVINFSIIIDRLLNNKFIDYSFVNFNGTKNEIDMTNEICLELEKIFNINLTDNEKNEMFILLITHINPDTSNNIVDLNQYIDKDIIETTKEILKRAENKFVVNLSDDRFVIPFMLHVNNLIRRAHNNINIKNPILDIILKEHTIIFDITLFISMQIIENFHIDLTVDEMSFIALHIGGELEYQKFTVNKISTAILCPNYLDIDSKITNEILNHFGNELQLIIVTHDFDMLKKYTIDLLISTIKVKEVVNFETVIVSPFLTSNNMLAIQDSIQKCKANINYKIIKDKFNDYFNDKLFFIDNKSNSKEDVIKLLSSELQKLNYVDDTFYSKVLKREDAVSTAYGSFAIPHSIDMDAFHSCFAVYLNPKGIVWGNQTVNLVLLVAINQNDRVEFLKLYDGLFHLLSNKKNTETLYKCSSFDEFKEIIHLIIKN